jgi:hypothetical protein
MKVLGVVVFVLLFGLFLTNPGDRLDAEIRTRRIADLLAEHRARAGGNPAQVGVFDALALAAVAAGLSVVPQNFGLFTLYDVRGPIFAGQLEPRRCLGAATMLVTCWTP